MKGPTQKEKIMNFIQVFRRSYIFIPVIFVVGLSIGMLTQYKGKVTDIVYNNPKNSEIKTSSFLKNDDFYKFPILQTSLQYFSKDDLGGGNVGKNGDLDKPNTWDFAYLGGDDTYHSFPTTTITLSKNDYSNEIRTLPPVTTKEQYLGLSNIYTLEDYRNNYEKNLHTDDFFVDKEPTWNEVVGEFGDFGARFLSGEYDGAKWDVAVIEEADVDNDNQKEKIVYMSENLDHFDQRILIIKDQKIIFSINSSRDSSSRIIPSKTGNGFYLKWVDFNKHYEDTGYCCPKGYMKTRFVFENRKFKPAYEQEILYTDVENVK